MSSREASPPPLLIHQTSWIKNNPEIKVLLLERIHENATISLEKEGFRVTNFPKAMSEDELVATLPKYHVVGIRSKTKLTERVLKACTNLLAIGCFCIGTDQVDLECAGRLGIPVFNSPFSNSRSVAELMISHIISLSRKINDKSRELHSGVWNKTATNCREVRGKTLGIVGYGHIGSQLSVLAESMGLNVIFYDIEAKLSLGNATQEQSLEALLKKADFVSLHVPDTEETRGMMSKKRIKLMKKGSYLLNASRGLVVDLEALAEAIDSGHLLGCAVDVYPEEPEENTTNFITPLQNKQNCILTPHIGGSTEEAQLAIGTEVAGKLKNYITLGKTLDAVNFPQVEAKYGGPNSHRITNIHLNTPGVMRTINSFLSECNITFETLQTKGSIGYVVLDMDREAIEDVQRELKEMKNSIRTRILY